MAKDSGDNNSKLNGLDQDDEQTEQKSVKKAAKHDSGAADLERVTDYAEEKELSHKDIAGALTLIDNKRSLEVELKVARQKELAKVVIKKEDVELIVNEMEIPRSHAELRLREHAGSIVDALVSLTD